MISSSFSSSLLLLLLLRSIQLLDSIVVCYLWAVDSVCELCFIKPFASCLISSAESNALFTALGGFLAR